MVRVWRTIEHPEGDTMHVSKKISLKLDSAALRGIHDRLRAQVCEHTGAKVTSFATLADPVSAFVRDDGRVVCALRSVARDSDSLRVVGELPGMDSHLIGLYARKRALLRSWETRKRDAGAQGVAFESEGAPEAPSDAPKRGSK